MVDGIELAYKTVTVAGNLVGTVNLTAGLHSVHMINVGASVTAATVEVAASTAALDTTPPTVPTNLAGAAD